MPMTYGITPTAPRLLEAPVHYGETYASPPKRPVANSRSKLSTARPLDIASMLRGNVTGGPGNRIKHRLSASKLQQLKARTRCLSCKEIGHWRRECPNRRTPTTLLSAMLMQELEGRPDAAKIVLWVISEDDDEYSAYLTFASTSPSTFLAETSIGENKSLDTRNTFDDMFGGVTECLVYEDAAAEEDANTLFNNIFDANRSDPDF